MGRRLAIVLRGVPGAGKSTVSNALRQHYGLSKSAIVVLDRRWGYGEERFLGPSRYDELLSQPEILIIELGYGEPAGEGFPGATRNPHEWINVLQNDGRTIIGFLLHVDKSECLQRVHARDDLSPRYAAMAWDRYAPGGVCSSAVFSSRIGDSYREYSVNTKDKDLAATIQQILGATTAAGSTLCQIPIP